MSKLRVGVAGLGRGRSFVEVFSQTPGCEVVAVCDVFEKALEPYKDLAAHTEYDRFLEEGLDVVAVITPGPAHAEQSVKALESGAHVLCETPCVYSLDEARAVVAAVQRSGKKFMLAEDYIWMGWAVHLKQQAVAGAFGEIVYAEGDYTHDCRDLMLLDENGYVPYAERDKHPGAKKSWRATHLPPLFYCSHTLGPLLHIMEDRVVSALGLSTGTHTAPDLGTIDLEAGLLQTEKGAVIRLTNGFTVAHPYTLYYNLVGTKGSVKLLKASAGISIWYSETIKPKMTDWQPVPDAWSDRPDGENHLAVMVRDFVESIVNDTPAPLDVFRSLDFVLPGITAHQSAMQAGAKLPVPNLRFARVKPAR